MTKIYWLLIFEPWWIVPLLFKTQQERDDNINDMDYESYRVFEYQIDTDYEDMDFQFLS